MTIIVAKIRFIIDVVGSYFYDKTSLQKNGLFVLGGPGTHLQDILWAAHDIKNHCRSEGEEIVAEFSVTVGRQAERCSVVCAFLSYARVVRALSL